MTTTERLAAALASEASKMRLAWEGLTEGVRAMFVQRAARIEERLRAEGLALVSQRSSNPWRAAAKAVPKSAKRRRDSKPAKRQRLSNLQRSRQ